MPWPRTAYMERVYFGLQFVCIHVKTRHDFHNPSSRKAEAVLSQGLAGQSIQSNQWAPGSERYCLKNLKCTYIHICVRAHISTHENTNLGVLTIWLNSDTTPSIRPPRCEGPIPHLSQTVGASHKLFSLMFDLATKVWGPTAPIFVFSHLLGSLTA